MKTSPHDAHLTITMLERLLCGSWSSDDIQAGYSRDAGFDVNGVAGRPRASQRAGYVCSMITAPSVAEQITPLVETLLGTGELPVGIRCWDGSRLGRTESSADVVLRSPKALRYLLYSPNELGFGRAYVSGELDIEGDIFEALRLRDLLGDADRHVSLTLGPAARVRLLEAARALGALGRPLPPPPQEARLRGGRHSKRRDASAVSHHYHVSNDFYRLFLGETMTYSCAYFSEPRVSLDHAQRAKYDVICRKLGLRPGMAFSTSAVGGAGCCFTQRRTLVCAPSE